MLVVQDTIGSLLVIQDMLAALDNFKVQCMCECKICYKHLLVGLVPVSAVLHAYVMCCKLNTGMIWLKHQ